MKVTLFPFLSVLLCMMGAMIMLLVVVAQNVREQAISPAAGSVKQTQMQADLEAEEQRQKIALQIEDADWLADNYREAQKKAKEELDDIQNRLAIAEKETQKIRDELARLDQLAQQLDRQTPVSPEEVEQLKQLLAQRQQLKAQTELELAELQKESAEKEKSYAIVPYRGQNGTYRRPIYIECYNNKIVIQPEGIELIPSDFLALDRPDNPFDTVLRVIRQYYNETNQIVRGSEPYPLWIIRPSGVAMYEGAQQAIGNWVNEFGYEIVNEDWNIEYPIANDELRKRMMQQLEIARSRLSGYLVAKQRADRSAGYNGSGQQFRMDHHGNVVPTSGVIPTGEDMQNRLAEHRQPTATPARTSLQTGHQAGSQESGKEFPTALTDSLVMTTPQGNENSFAENENKNNTEQQTNEEPTEPAPTQNQQPFQPQDQKPPNGQKNWGLKDVSQFASSISRTVRIRCEANRFVLVAQVGLSTERIIPITDSVSAAADRLVQAIWEFQDSWGSAGENVFWLPRLQVQVLPGGEQRIAQLKVHLKNSGLAIE